MSPYQITWQVYENSILIVIYNLGYNGLQQSRFDINDHLKHLGRHRDILRFSLS